MHAHFQHRHTWQLCIYVHSLLGAARYNHSLRLPAAEQLQPSSWGVKGISTVAVEGQIGILVIQTSLRGRASLEAEKKMSLFVSNLNDRVYLYSNFQQKRTIGEDLKETQGEKKDIWWDLNR